MALKVEDGTGGDAMISLAGFKTYCANVGYDLTDFDDDAVIEQAIRRGSMYISNGWEPRFQGYRIGFRAQFQAFPRYNVATPEGWTVDSTTIPREAQAATAEASYYELLNPNGLNPSVVLADRVSSERVGPIQVDYAATGMDIGASRPVLVIINDLLRPLLSTTAAGTNAIIARAERG